MKFLVVGCGSIGERHIQNLKILGYSDIIACDTDLQKLSKIQEKYNLKGYENFKDALAKEKNVNAMLVCTPTSLHVPVALNGVKKGLHLFIEKPLSHNLNKVDELIVLAKQKKLVIFVGFNMRFNPVIIKIKELLDEKRIGRVLSGKVHFGSYLPDRHPWEDYRQGYGARKALGGGVILDAIHTIDFMQLFIGKIKEVFCYAGKISELEIDVEDNAEIFLRFENRAVATIHLDFIQRPYRYYCELIGEKGTIIADFVDSTVKVYDVKTKKWDIFKCDKDTNLAYIEEIKHFVKCIEKKAYPFVDGEAGKKLLEIALLAKKSARLKKPIKVRGC